MITDSQIETGQLKADLKEKVVYTLLRKHRHQTKKSNLRSLADIGKSVSSASRLFSNQENGNTGASLVQSFQFVMKEKIQMGMIYLRIYSFQNSEFRLFLVFVSYCGVSQCVKRDTLLPSSA